MGRIISLTAFVCLLLAASAPAAAAVIYVNKAATGANDGSSMADGFTTIQAGLNAAAAYDTVEIAAGLYEERLKTVRAYVTVQASAQDGFNGTVTVRGSMLGETLTVRHASTWRGLRLEGPLVWGPAYSVVRVTAGHPLFEDCVITSALHLLYLKDSGAEFVRCEFRDSKRSNYQESVTVLAPTESVVFRYCSFVDLGYGFMNLRYSGEVDFDNCFFGGFFGPYVYLPPDATVSGHVRFTNCLGLGNGPSSYPAVYNDSMADVEVRNSLIQSPGFYTSSPFYRGNVTVTDSIDQAPGLRHGRRQALLNITIDDSLNFLLWTRIADECDLHGFKTTYALDTWMNGESASSWAWSQIRQRIDRGHELASHTVHHVPLTLRQVLDIRYDDPRATSARLNVDNAAGRLTVTVQGVAGADLDMPLDFAGPYPLIHSLQAAISAVPGYSCVLRRGSDQETYDASAWPSHLLDDVTGADILGKVRTLRLNDEQAFDEELTRSKEFIEANVPGYSCQTLVYPNLQVDYPTIAAATARGYTCARTGTQGTWDMAGEGGYNVMGIYAKKPSALFGRYIPEPELRRRVASFLEFVKFRGAAVSIYSHGEKEYTLAEWRTLISLLAEDPEVRIVTLKEMTEEIRAQAESCAGTLCTRRTWPDDADLRPAADSPLLDAGLPIPGVTVDVVGTPVPQNGATDIGLYEMAP